MREMHGSDRRNHALRHQKHPTIGKACKTEYIVPRAPEAVLSKRFAIVRRKI